MSPDTIATGRSRCSPGWPAMTIGRTGRTHGEAMLRSPAPMAKSAFARLNPASSSKRSFPGVSGPSRRGSREAGVGGLDPRRVALELLAVRPNEDEVREGPDAVLVEDVLVGRRVGADIAERRERLPLRLALGEDLVLHLARPTGNDSGRRGRRRLRRRRRDSRRLGLRCLWGGLRRCGLLGREDDGRRHECGKKDDPDD